MRAYSIQDGEQLVRAARNAIELSITNPHFHKDIVTDSLNGFGRANGVFVTLEHYPTMELRGCIGFPRAIVPLKESLVDSAIGAAFEDPRFVSVSKNELGELLVSVSILSTPSKLNGTSKSRMDSIRIGRDGLLVEYGLYSGLLLPIVAVQEGWGKKKFLEEVCRKAGIHSDYWSQPNVNLYTFQTQVFKEEIPEGKVIEIKYDDEKR